MDFSKVKLIVSDMDGTLLNSHEQVSDLFFEQFQELQRLGIHFVAASGRQYASIVHKLEPIKNEITVVAENGGVAKRKGEQLHLEVMNADQLISLLPVLRSIDDIFVVFCGEHSAYIETEDPKLIQMFREYYGSYKVVKDLKTVAAETPILKIALYHPTSSEQFIYPKVKQFQKDFLLKISGNHWLDISSEASNKGNALKVIQQQMNITPEETLVFGDYMNDLEMLEQAYFSYAMKNAHPEVKKIARFETDSHNDLGVEKVLSKVIRFKTNSIG